MKPIEIYNARVKAGELVHDHAQSTTLQQLQDLAIEIEGYKPRSKWLLSGVFGVAPPRPKGLYIYGGVGRGKSMLMDLFFDASPINRKRRVHFHSFMQEVHDELHKVRATGVSDAIKPVADKIIRSASLLCFDEMQITDITDAMIVGRLFEHMFDSGVIVVTTSNRHPDDLYKSGLNRDLFLPFIELIKERLHVENLDSDTDHRQNALASRKLYFHPLNEESKIQVNKLWNDLVDGEVQPLELHQKKRKLTLPKYSNGIAKASFADLCEKPLGPSDFLLIAKSLRCLFITDVPKLERGNANAAKRFVTLIDALYEAKVPVVISADAEPDALYKTGDGSFEFERTASRLHEMQSADFGVF